jgi:hypothetical protein
MRKSITTKSFPAIALLALLGGSAAIAQTGGGAGSSAGSASTAGASSDNRTSGGAPVGHRQPRLTDVPSEKNLSDPNDPLSKENAALDRKIKSICRGC